MASENKKTPADLAGATHVLCCLLLGNHPWSPGITKIRDSAQEIRSGFVGSGVPFLKFFPDIFIVLMTVNNSSS